MASLTCFPAGSMLADPFADYLNVTVSKGDGPAVRLRLVELLDYLGPKREEPADVFRLFSVRNGAASSSVGSVRFGARGQVATISTSGGVLSLLRAAGMLDEWLSAIAEVPHRVSLLHATADYVVSSPPSVIQEVKAAASAGSLALTRKRIMSQHVKFYMGLSADGQETGTVYLGKRENADVWAKIYDKRQERLDRGFSDPGSLVRVEVSVQSDVGATLRDVANPGPLFFYFAGRSLVEVPSGTPAWSAHGEGYAVGPRVVRPVVARLERLLEDSLDVGRLVELAREAYGAEAGRVLGRMVGQRCAVAPGLVGT